jgi:hypothetical protein
MGFTVKFQGQGYSIRVSNCRNVGFVVEDLETREREGANVAAESFRLHDSNSSRETAPPPVQSVLSEQKIRSIMNYLDEVDTAERLTEMDVVSANYARWITLKTSWLLSSG